MQSTTIDASDNLVGVAAVAVQPVPWPAQQYLANGAPALTDREREVLLLVSRGLTAVAIGWDLGISAGTVRKHLENVYRKLACGDRLVAVDRARRWGLIDA